MHPDAPLFFDSMPQLIPLYEAFEVAVLALYPAAQLRVQKTQISFYDPGLFVCVSLPPRKAGCGLVVSFSLQGRSSSARMLAASEIRPGRWTHHVLLRREEEIDCELTGWLDISHSLARRIRR